MRAIWLSALTLLLGCGSSGRPPTNEPSPDERSVFPTSKHYSEVQIQKLTLCAGYGVVVYQALLSKDAGSTVEQELRLIRQKSPESLDYKLEAILRDLYSQPDDSHLAVLGSFYDELCVQTFANIPDGQRAVAQRCLLATYISMEAYAGRVAGGTEAKMQQYFASNDSTRAIAEPIVARAFAGDARSMTDGYPRYSPLVLDEWLSCFENAERS